MKVKDVVEKQHEDFLWRNGIVEGMIEYWL